MKRLFLFVFLFFACIFAGAQQPQTPNYQFWIPAHGTLNYDTYLNANFSQLDGLLFQALVNQKTSDPSPCTGQIWYNTTAAVYKYCPGGTPTVIAAGAFAAGTDLAGTSTNQTVIGIEGNVLPSLAAGYLQWTGSAWTFGAGGGTLTGVNTNAGSGLTGGASSGSPNLSLITTCSNTQILQYLSGSWTCSSAGTGNLLSNPPGSQHVNNPFVTSSTTEFDTNNLAFYRYVTAWWNWNYTDSGGSLGNATSPGSITFTLPCSSGTPCPSGIDTNSAAHNYLYKIYISGTGTPEAALVTGGTCTPGATSSCTMVATTLNAHPNGYTIGSASTGIQEAWNDAWVEDGCAAASSCAAPVVALMPDTNYNVYAAVYMRGRGGELIGDGALVASYTRDRTIFVGSPPTGIGYHKIHNLTIGPTLNVDGVQVQSVCAGASCSPTQSNGTYLITTVAAHGFVAGQDTAACEYRSQTAGAHFSLPVVSTPSATTLTVTSGSTANFATGATTFGFCIIQNVAIEDDSDHVDMTNVHIIQSNPSTLGYFSDGIMVDNDQQAQIDKLTNRSTSVIKNSANWPLGAMVWGRYDSGNAALVYIHNTEITNVNCYDGGGNGLVIEDTVCQAFPVFGVRYNGGLVPAKIDSNYQASGVTNPLYTGGFDAKEGQMGLWLSGGSRVIGNFPIVGTEPTFDTNGGSASTQYNYFVQPIASSLGGSSGTWYGPVWFIGRGQPPNGSDNITVEWPSIELQDAFFGQSIGTLTWNLYSTTGNTVAAPYGTGNFLVAGAISGSCGTNGMCSYVDTQAARTSIAIPNQTLQPHAWFWPADVVTNGTIVSDTLYGHVVGSQGVNVSTPVQVTPTCQGGGVSSERSPGVVSCLNSNNVNQATILASTAGQTSGSKGRLNFGPNQDIGSDKITLYDSNSAKTFATAGERPSNDAGDAAIAFDQSGGLATRAPTSLSFYINQTASGSGFLARLISSGWSFSTPVIFSSGFNVTFAGLTSSGNQCLHVSSTGVLSGTGFDCGTAVGGTVTSVGSGTGLTGGPITSSGTLALAAAYQLPQTCTNGQTNIWNSTSSTWTCLTLATGTVTSVAAGTGLTGGTITSTGTLALATAYQLPQSCSNNQVPEWSTSGSDWVCLTLTGTGTVTSVGATVNGGSSSGALAITGSPVTTSGTINLAFTGSNGDVMTFGASNAPTDSGTLLSSLAPLASPTFTGTVTANNLTVTGTCTGCGGGAGVNVWFSPSTASSTLTAGTQNTTKVFAVYFPQAVTTVGFCYYVATADNTANVYDIGIYSATGTNFATGTLIVHTGPTAGTTLFPSTNVKCQAWASSGTVPAGYGAIAITSSASSPAAEFGGTLNVLAAAYAVQNVGTTTSGTLNSSQTLPNITSSSWTNTSTPNFQLH
jgi:hypothetical protein